MKTVTIQMDANRLTLLLSYIDDALGMCNHVDAPEFAKTDISMARYCVDEIVGSIPVPPVPVAGTAGWKPIPDCEIKEPIVNIFTGLELL
jgi:hypothetical protein